MFITFEGIDGSGKSTQIQRLASSLKEDGHRVEVFRDPGGTHLSEELRKLVKYLEGDKGPCREAELLLFGAARAQLAERAIRPALEEGAIVLCDRFADSTTAYQGYGRGFPLAHIQNIHQVAGNLTPDLTILLDLSPGDSWERCENREETKGDRFDNLALEFHEKVRNGFLAIAEENYQRMHVFDARESEDNLAGMIRDLVSEVMG
jgi:dTMP kinase